MSMQDEMKKDISKTFVWKGKEITITNAFTSYEGDFYEYKKKAMKKFIELTFMQI